MTATPNLDTLQHGAIALRRGIRFPLFGIELLVLRKSEGLTPVLCSRGWSGLTLRVLGNAVVVQLKDGDSIQTPSKRVEVSRRHEFSHLGVIGKSAVFLEIRFGRRWSRSKVIEVMGDQVNAVMIEKVERRRHRDLDKLVVSSADDQEMPPANLEA